MPSLILISLHIVGVMSQDITWFKQTEIHYENVLEVQNGWIDCPEWHVLSEANLSLSPILEPLQTLRIPQTNNSRYNFTAKCIIIQVPLIWDEDDLNFPNNTNETDTIDYFITRIYSSSNVNNMANNGAFWMLSGGPGGRGSALYPVAIPWLTFINATYDLYIPDHRGTGRSDNLRNCPFELMHLISNCTQYLDDIYDDDLHYFSTYSASMDLGYVMDLFINNLTIYTQNNTIIYGISYGTYYLNQYLQLFPDQANAAILDGICASDGCRISQYDNNTNNIGLDFLHLCDEDSFCGQQFNSSVIDVLDEIFKEMSTKSNISSTHCYDDLIPTTTAEWKNIFHLFLLSVETRVFIPAMIYRLQRCNTDDVMALNNMLQNLYKVNVTNLNVTDSGVVLQKNIILSEIWYGLDPRKPGPSYSELVALSDDYYFSSGISAALRLWWDEWNRYTPNRNIYNNYADPPIPMLLLNGDLDPQTPLKWALRANDEYGADSNNRYYYTIPNAPHFVMLQSPIINYTDDTLYLDHDFETCGFHIMASFIDPQRDFVPNAQCINWLTPIDWKGDGNITQKISEMLFGTNNMWDIQVDENVSNVTTTDEPIDVNTTSTTGTTATSTTTMETSSTNISTTDSTTESGTESGAGTPSTDTDDTWLNVAIAFIVLFAIATCMIVALFWKICKISGGDRKHKYTAPNQIETGPLKTQVAEDSDHDYL